MSQSGIPFSPYPNYELARPIDIFTTYDGKRASDIAVSRYAVRHMITAEVVAFLAHGMSAKWRNSQIERVVSVQPGDAIEKDMTAGARRGKKGSPKDVSEDNIDIADRVSLYFGSLKRAKTIC